MILNDRENIIKHKGRCRNKVKWKYCYYWRAKQSKLNAKVTIGYYCALFDEDKTGPLSLLECNTKYGRTYEGRKE